MENGENSVIEMELTKKMIRDDKPLNVCVAILQYSKLLMLDFVYNVLYRYLEPKSFVLNYADTDSLCISEFLKKINKLFQCGLFFMYNNKSTFRFYQEWANYKPDKSWTIGSDNFTACQAGSTERVQSKLEPLVRSWRDYFGWKNSGQT